MKDRKFLYLLIFKPVTDFVLALLGILILSPIFILLVLLLTIANQGKPFFFQLRPGKRNKIFRLIKFRSMNNHKNEFGKLLPDAARITIFGSFVRRTSLDEIPQLINVLKGDMSLIGPRPLLVEYLPLYNEWQSRRHEVRPGITGWAQVNGRNSLNWEEKFELDVWYVDNLSFKIDAKILYLTILKVMRSEGINKNDHATMPSFKGKETI